VDVVFTRAELQPVLDAIRAELVHSLPLDSPHRLQDALHTVIRRGTGHGEVTVRRSPAALLTPEYWHVMVTGVDEGTDDRLRSLLAVPRR
jgi:hypothetical protein